MTSKSHIVAAVIGILIGGAIMTVVNGTNQAPPRGVRGSDTEAPGLRHVGQEVETGDKSNVTLLPPTPIPQSIATESPVPTEQRQTPQPPLRSRRRVERPPNTSECWDPPAGGLGPSAMDDDTTAVVSPASRDGDRPASSNHYVEWRFQPALLYGAFYGNVLEPASHRVVFARPHARQRLGIVFVEPKAHPWIIGAVRNIAHVYGGEDVSLFIFTSPEAMPFMRFHFRGWTNVQYEYAPATLTWQCHGHWLTSPEFYTHFLDGPEFILMTQKDVLIQSKVTSEMLSYPYVGAPWARMPFGQCEQPWVGNGGYSIRHVKSMLRLTDQQPRSDIPEDVWFCWQIRAQRLKQCPVEVAKAFAMEQIWNLESTGAHGIYRDQPVERVAEYMTRLVNYTTPDFARDLSEFRKLLLNWQPVSPKYAQGNQGRLEPKVRRRPGRVGQG